MIQTFSSAWLLIGFSALATCAGNLLLKQASLVQVSPGLFSILMTPLFAGAIACYLCDLVIFTQALQKLPVSLVVPVVSGVRIAMTAIFAKVIFHEHFTFAQALASGLIVLGIILITRN